jgi:hypothetical protein
MICFPFGPVNNAEGFSVRIEENVVRISFLKLVVTDTEIVQGFNDRTNFAPAGVSE